MHLSNKIIRAGEMEKLHWVNIAIVIESTVDIVEFSGNNVR